MMAASDALSTSVTKSLCCFLETWIRSRSSEARLMICPARRAALTAMLSMGCMGRDPFADDETGEQEWRQRTAAQRTPQVGQSRCANVPSTKDELDKSEAPDCGLAREWRDFTRVSSFPARADGRTVPNMHEQARRRAIRGTRAHRARDAIVERGRELALP